MKNETEKRFYQYREWFEKLSKETGGLILQATAARLLNTPRQNISRMVKIGKLRTYQFSEENEIYIGLNEIEKIIQKRIERARETNNAPLRHKGNMNIKDCVDIEEISDHSPLEWAEEWIVTQPNLSFIEFINKKKNAWLKKNHNTKKELKINKNDPMKRKHIVLIEDDSGQLKYTCMLLIAPPQAID